MGMSCVHKGSRECSFGHKEGTLGMTMASVLVEIGSKSGVSDNVRGEVVCVRCEPGARKGMPNMILSDEDAIWPRFLGSSEF